ncbi:hypothetical protein DPMN_011128 [Dreissena polymorpha]|uniref:Uncharacterized protein n=1 Tax=Dreissena polymorpha TaxID=45954 RepID=A0A9D4S1M4_DREPO|nr:hypothetical protein DPMN_011128 [Dreissena polymorpha]
MQLRKQCLANIFFQQSFAKRGTLFTKATPVPKKGTPGRHCNGSTGGSGFTPVKLPAGLEGADRSLALPGTPSMSLLYSPFSSSMWQVCQLVTGFSLKDS